MTERYPDSSFYLNSPSKYDFIGKKEILAFLCRIECYLIIDRSICSEGCVTCSAIDLIRSASKECE